eukprot:446565-Amorphochlora_amoeboformis.AAC.1
MLAVTYRAKLFLNSAPSRLISTRGRLGISGAPLAKRWNSLASLREETSGDLEGGRKARVFSTATADQK